MKQTLLFALLATTVLAAPAAAQMYPGQGITVNPAAVNGGGYVSPYATGPYGNPYGGVIHLHMPKPVVHHHHVAARPKPADTSVATTTPADTSPPPSDAAPVAPAPSSSPYPPPLDSLGDTSAPPPKPAHHKKLKAASAPAPAATPAPATDSTDSTDSSGPAAMPLTLDPSNEIPPPAAPKKKSAERAEKTASADTAPTTTVISPPAGKSKSGLTRRSEILFPRGDPDISAATVDKMRAVAADLSTLLGAGAQHVQLDAYGGAPGDKSSDARRLSLKRALGIRQLLIEDGIPSEKIDVRAMGGIDDDGAPDRVDIMVRGG